MTNKHDERFQILIDEFNGKMEKTKQPKRLKFDYEDKIIRMFKNLISKSCANDFDKIFDAYKKCLKRFLGDDEVENDEI